MRASWVRLHLFIYSISHFWAFVKFFCRKTENRVNHEQDLQDLQDFHD